MKTYDLKNPYDIDEHFRNYCDMVYHVAPDKLPPIQLREIRTSFYGAFGMAMVCYEELWKNETPVVAASIVHDIMKQISTYMAKITLDDRGNN
jgi:hypothetical protein